MLPLKKRKMKKEEAMQDKIEAKYAILNKIEEKYAIQDSTSYPAKPMMNIALLKEIMVLEENIDTNSLACEPVYDIPTRVENLIYNECVQPTPQFTTFGELKETSFLPYHPTYHDRFANDLVIDNNFYLKSPVNSLNSPVHSLESFNYHSISPVSNAEPIDLVSNTSFVNSPLLNNGLYEEVPISSESCYYRAITPELIESGSNYISENTFSPSTSKSDIITYVPSPINSAKYEPA